MPSSPSTLASEYDDMDVNSSPIRPRSPAIGDRRSRSDLDDDDDESQRTPTRRRTTTSTATTSSNALVFVKRHAANKKLKPERMAEVDKFMALPLNAMLGILFVDHMLEEERAIAAAKKEGSLKISRDVQQNIKARCYAVLLATSTVKYKGDALTTTISMAIAKHGYDLPADIITNTAKYHVLFSNVSKQLTEARSTIKKDIYKSFNMGAPPKGTPAPKAPNSSPTLHQPLQAFAKALARHLGPEFNITYEFAARAALLRKAFLRDQDESFWGSLEDEIVAIRRVADSRAAEAKDKLQENPDATDCCTEAAEHLARLFKTIMSADRRTHGTLTKEKDGIDALPRAAPELVADGTAEVL
ncbi:hypothetical protein C8F01DRAFT_1079451 [Mycena amicta]|nr:hypothetical protein C8F01DRAFT_1079451 [Mycena amicta]